MHNTISNKNLNELFKTCNVIYDYDFTWNKIDKTIFNGYRFINCIFPKISKKIFNKCTFSECKFISSKDIIFNNCNISSVNFSDSVIVNMQFKECTISKCNFYNSIIENNFSFIECRECSSNLFLHLQCPEEGSFIGYKKLKSLEGKYICKLLIPSDAKRSSATTRKCRCSKAKVLEIKSIETGKNVDEVEHWNPYEYTLYKVGEYVYPDSFDENRWNECSNGIHFYITKKEALNHIF